MTQRCVGGVPHNTPTQPGCCAARHLLPVSGCCAVQHPEVPPEGPLGSFRATPRARPSGHSGPSRGATPAVAGPFRGELSRGATPSPGVARCNTPGFPLRARWVRLLRPRPAPYTPRGAPSDARRIPQARDGLSTGGPKGSGRSRVGRFDEPRPKPMPPDLPCPGLGTAGQRNPSGLSLMMIGPGPVPVLVQPDVCAVAPSHPVQDGRGPGPDANGPGRPRRSFPSGGPDRTTGQEPYSRPGKKSARPSGPTRLVMNSPAAFADPLWRATSDDRTPAPPLAAARSRGPISKA